MSRASEAASVMLGRKAVPGVDTESIAVATFSSAMVASEPSGLHCGSVRPPDSSILAFRNKSR